MNRNSNTLIERIAKALGTVPQAEAIYTLGFCVMTIALRNRIPKDVVMKALSEQWDRCAEAYDEWKDERRLNG